MAPDDYWKISNTINKQESTDKYKILRIKKCYNRNSKIEDNQ